MYAKGYFVLFVVSNVYAGKYKLTVNIDGSCLSDTELSKEEYVLRIYSGDRQLIKEVPGIDSTTISEKVIDYSNNSNASAVKVEVMEDDSWYDDYILKCNIGVESNSAATASSTCASLNYYANSGTSRSQCEEAVRLKLEKLPDTEEKKAPN